MVWQSDDRLFVEDCVFRQHPVGIGANSIGQILGLDRSAKPTRMKAAGNPIANFDPRNAFADWRDLARAVGQ